MDDQHSGNTPNCHCCTNQHSPCSGQSVTQGQKKYHREIAQRSGGAMSKHTDEHHTGTPNSHVRTTPPHHIEEHTHLKVVLRLFVPILRIPDDTMTNARERQQKCHSEKHEIDALILLDSHRFPELRRSRAVQVETNHPHPCPIQHLPFLPLVLRFRRRRLVQVQIRCDPTYNVNVNKPTHSPPTAKKRRTEQRVRYITNSDPPPTF